MMSVHNSLPIMYAMQNQLWPQFITNYVRKAIPIMYAMQDQLWP